MDLFKLRVEDEPVGIYARVPQHIIDLVSHYHEQCKGDGRLDDPQTAKWVRKVPTLDDIAKVEWGGIRYHVGMMMMKTGDEEADADVFCERMKVTDDFEIAASPESVLYFDAHRQRLPASKRGELYPQFDS